MPVEEMPHAEVETEASKEAKKIRDREETYAKLNTVLEAGDISTLKEMVKSGEYESLKEIEGYNPIFDFAEKGDIKALTLLKEAGVDLSEEEKNIKGLKNINIAHIAAANGNMEFLSSLKDMGVDLDKKNDEDITPLMVAAGMNNTEVVKGLLQNGADIEGNKLGVTPLMLCTNCGNLETMEACLAAGSDVNATDKDGNTAIQIAILNGDKEAVAYLWANGARTDFQTKEGCSIESLVQAQFGKTTAELASEFGYKEQKPREERKGFGSWFKNSWLGRQLGLDDASQIKKNPPKVTEQDMLKARQVVETVRRQRAEKQAQSQEKQENAQAKQKSRAKVSTAGKVKAGDVKETSAAPSKADREKESAETTAKKATAEVVVEDSKADQAQKSAPKTEVQVELAIDYGDVNDRSVDIEYDLKDFQGGDNIEDLGLSLLEEGEEYDEGLDDKGNQGLAENNNISNLSSTATFNLGPGMVIDGATNSVPEQGLSGMQIFQAPNVPKGGLTLGDAASFEVHTPPLNFPENSGLFSDMPDMVSAPRTANGNIDIASANNGNIDLSAHPMVMGEIGHQPEGTRTGIDIDEATQMLVKAGQSKSMG